MTLKGSIDDERRALTPKSPSGLKQDEVEVEEEYVNQYENGYDPDSPAKSTKSRTYHPLEIFKRIFFFLEFPKVVWLILASETAERYAFYGFKTILPLYLTDYLKWTEDQATVIVHSFIFLAYFTPIIGSFLADGYFGKFITIFLFSIIYCIGQTTVSLTSIPGVTGDPPRSWGIFIGLALVALGSGGIKPNVSAFGANQFSSKNSALITSFFAMFYLSVNLGSTFSTVITPIVRTYVNYSIAFAIPAFFMFVATVVFIIGYPWYKIVKPKENIVSLVLKILFFGVIYSIRDFFKFIFRQKREKVSHWLDRAKSVCDNQLVEETKLATRIVFVFVPVAMFFALFDQHSSRFVFQASHMNRNFFGLKLDADQIQVLNPLLIIILLPLFDRIIYPFIGLFDRVFKFTPLKRIGWGFLFTALSFVFSGLVSFFIQYFGDDQVHVAAQFPQFVALGIGEVLVSVTVLEFAYQQAPPRMKSIMTACYLLSVSAGNIIVLIVAALPIPDFSYKQMTEFFVFSGLMIVNLGFFILITLRYKYRDSSNDDSIFTQDIKKIESTEEIKVEIEES